MIQLTINGNVESYEEGLTYEDVARIHQKEYADKIVLVKLGNRYRELFKRLEEDGELSFVTMADAEGMRTYRRSVCFLMYYAARKLAGDKFIDIRVIHDLQQGSYCEITRECEVEQTPEFIAALDAKMREIVQEALPIRKKNVSTGKAREIFAANGMFDKERLFRYRRVSHTNIYELDGYMDYFYGYMLGNTSYLDVFRVEPYKNGFVLLYPSRNETTKVAEFTGSPKFYDTLMNATAWGMQVGMPIVAGLNDVISSGKMQETMLAQEALMERNLSEIGEQIRTKGNVKFVMIAGPSSSGKTTFANRLCVQLYAQGLVPHLISLDDFYMDRDKMLPDENGEFDYEAVEALDVEAINQTLNALSAGETVSMPTFNFKKGQQEFHGNYLKLEKDDVLVIEGIHGLNNLLSRDIPENQKFKIYISALSQLNIDENNCMAVSDCRLMRRIVRDARTRGSNAADTISRWPSVRAGEEKHIFPYQENADVMYNSALVYELALIKVYVEPLLFGIPEDLPEATEARRLLKILDYVLPYPSDSLNNNSIAREFVGGSCFNV